MSKYSVYDSSNWLCRYIDQNNVVRERLLSSEPNNVLAAIETFKEECDIKQIISITADNSNALSPRDRAESKDYYQYRGDYPDTLFVVFGDFICDSRKVGERAFEQPPLSKKRALACYKQYKQIYPPVGRNRDENKPLVSISIIEVRADTGAFHNYIASYQCYGTAWIDNKPEFKIDPELTWCRANA